VLSTLLLFALSKPWLAHHKKATIYNHAKQIAKIITNFVSDDILNFLMVDQAGVEPASRTLFSLLHTAITYSIYLFLRFVNCFGDDVIHFLVYISDLFHLLLRHHVGAF
jgi:hypothetical protein